MPTIDVQEYGTRLFQRRNTGLVVERASVAIGDWHPTENRCHENVSLWCLQKPTCQPVRGWLFFSFEGQMPYVQFMAHSVVRLEDGSLRDITPAQTFQLYPFIPAEGCEDEYAALIEIGGIQYLQYELATGHVFRRASR
jgi:hypothetical protein